MIAGRLRVSLVSVGEHCLTCLTSLHMTRSPGPSLSVFAYCKQAKTGGGNGLGMRLDYVMGSLYSPGVFRVNA